MEDFGENIFLNAAFWGKYSSQRRRAVSVQVTAPELYSGPALPVLIAQAKYIKKGEQRKPYASRHTYSKIEDLLILKAVELCGRDWIDT